MKKLILIVLMVFTAKLNGYSQAFRMNYLGVANPLHTGTEATTLPFSIGLGYEQNIGYRLAVTLEYNISYDNFINPRVIIGNDGEEYPHSGTTKDQTPYNFDYALTYPMSEIGYQSKYFFLDNDDHSAYFSTGLSLLMIDYTWKIRGNSYNNAQPPSDFKTGSFRETITSVPISFRFGYRGPTNGFFGDYSFGFKYNLSGDKQPTLSSYHYVNDESALRDFSFVMNLSWGFGWAKRSTKQP